MLYSKIAAAKFLCKLNHQIANIQAGDLNSKIENLFELVIQRLDDVVPLKPSVSRKKVP